MDFPMPVSDQPRASSAEILSAHVSMPHILWHPIGKCQRYPIMLFHNTTDMTVGERIKEARLRRRMSRPELASASGVPYPTLAGIENGDQAGTTQLPEIASALRVRPEWLKSGRGTMDAELPQNAGWVDVQGYAQAAGLGNGAEAEEYADTHSLKFKATSLRRKRLQSDNLAVFYGKGDSMLPRIKSGDAILFDTSDVRPVDGSIFIILWRGEYYAKRAEILDDAVYFRTDNPSGDHNWNKPKRMDAKRDPITIIGRVRWIGSWED